MTANLSQKVRRHSLLLVDDDPDILGLLKSQFRDEPFEVITAADGSRL